MHTFTGFDQTAYIPNTESTSLSEDEHVENTAIKIKAILQNYALVWFSLHRRCYLIAALKIMGWRRSGFWKKI
jgi:hypothetical protein